MTSLFFTTAHGQNYPTPAQPQRIKILSWNIYMLPGFLGAGKLQRSEAIGRLLANSEYTVLVFQEAFHAPARKRIRQQLKAAYPYEAGPANAKSFSFRTNSGLWIWSKFPIVSQQEIVFENRYGVDALSRKGALLVELDIRGQRMQVIATHLQNAGSARFKEGQCKELFDKLLKNFQRPGIPQVICGDFNIDRYEAEDTYRKMLTTLQANDSELAAGSFSYDRLVNDLTVEPGTKRELIDFILTRENASGISRLRQGIRVFRHRWSARHQDLSDHYALEAEIDFHNTDQLVAASAVR
jgi:phospholipase C